MNEVIKVSTESEVGQVRQLFRDYADSLPIKLCFQNFDQELASLPGAYAAPGGALFLAVEGDRAIGCIGIRRFSQISGELKRLYVSPASRGHGAGKTLISAAIGEARAIGYKELVLDTLASMRAAIALYESFGFHRADAYYPNPLPDVVYFRKNF
jgi:carbonic anhydrase